MMPRMRIPENIAPLQLAAYMPHVPGLIPFLIEQGAHVDEVVDTHGHASLHYAVLGKEGKNAETLIRHGADVNKKTVIGGHTPLHLAAMMAQEEMAELLANNGAKIEEKDYKGMTPADLAAINFVRSNHTDLSAPKVMTLFFKRQAQPSQQTGSMEETLEKRRAELENKVRDDPNFRMQQEMREYQYPRN